MAGKTAWSIDAVPKKVYGLSSETGTRFVLRHFGTRPGVPGAAGQAIEPSVECRGLSYTIGRGVTVGGRLKDGLKATLAGTALLLCLLGVLEPCRGEIGVWVTHGTERVFPQDPRAIRDD